MLTKAVVSPLWVWSRVNNNLKPIKGVIKVNKIKKQKEEAMPGVNSAHMCLSAAAAAVRREGTAKKKLWGCSTSGRSPPDRFSLSLQRRGSRKLLNTDISLATGFHQSRGRTTVRGTNLHCSLSLPLLFLWKKRKEKENRKKKKKVPSRHEVDRRNEPGLFHRK